MAGRTLRGVRRGRLPVSRHPPFPSGAASAAVPDPSGHRPQWAPGAACPGVLYELVADTAEYRLFVPWCSRSAVLSRRGQVLQAELEAGFPPVLERYSEVLLGPQRIQAVSWACRLFRRLETLWRFRPGLPGRTDTCVLVPVELRSALHARLAGLFLDAVARRAVSAFEAGHGRCSGRRRRSRPARGGDAAAVPLDLGSAGLCGALRGSAGLCGALRPSRRAHVMPVSPGRSLTCPTPCLFALPGSELPCG